VVIVISVCKQLLVMLDQLIFLYIKLYTYTVKDNFYLLLNFCEQLMVMIVILVCLIDNQKNMHRVPYSLLHRVCQNH